MRNKIYWLLSLPCILFAHLEGYAQNGVVETTMRSNNKIYVVMAVCITILVGLFIYLVSIDKKIAKIEDRQ